MFAKYSRKIYICNMKSFQRDRETLEVEFTDDGSATLFVKSMNEHYHSVKGALTESNHIFRDCAFLYRDNGEKRPLRLLEIGFGTGLNACVTAMAVEKASPVHYFSLEKYPVEADVLEQLHYEKFLDASLFSAIHRVPWNQPVDIIPGFTLEKRMADYLTDPLPNRIDVVYFDAFAPEKQPEMWTREAFLRMFEVMNPGAVLTTYCAKGEIRRMLASIGLQVERIPGPVGGKREILRATKPFYSIQP